MTAARALMRLVLASDVLIAVSCTQKENLICHVSFDVAWRPRESPFIIIQETKSNLKTRNLKIHK